MFKHFGIIFTISILFINASNYRVSDFKAGLLSSSPPAGFHSVDTGEEVAG